MSTSSETLFGGQWSQESLEENNLYQPSSPEAYNLLTILYSRRGVGKIPNFLSYAQLLVGWSGTCCRTRAVYGVVWGKH